MEPKSEIRTESRQRQQVLRELLREGLASTQEELCEALKTKKFRVTQSTISRDLRKINAIKATDGGGQTVYKLGEEQLNLAPTVSSALGGLLIEVKFNESMIVIKSSPGSASLVARHLDDRSEKIGILGTIAGDDTVFVAPASTKQMVAIIKRIRSEFST